MRGGRDSEMAKPMLAQVTQNLAAVSTCYVIQRKMTILSGREAARVPIGQWTLKGDMKLVCRPRNHEGVFRFATLTNQEETPLLPGPVNIFAGNEFLGTTIFRDLIAVSQSFELPFGPDNRITVKREILSRKTTVGDDNETRQETVAITLTNHGKDSRIVTLEESLPTSTDSRIKIKMGDVVPEPRVQRRQRKGIVVVDAGAGFGDNRSDSVQD